jgi:hypothetical protein
MKERELWYDPEDDDSAVHLMALRGGERAGKKSKRKSCLKERVDCGFFIHRHV